MSSTTFKKTVWDFYKKHGRHDLPWRQTRNPYKVLVSEVMLQQTQVDRVISFYKNFIKKFPTARRLAAAPLADVLAAWQGLGYNRRALKLQEAAKVIARSSIPRSVEGLEALPGVGPYTARAVAAFAYNADVVFVETNIRTAVIHHFFARRESVSDPELAQVLATLVPRGKSGEWYSALMDYGAHLKKSGVQLNKQSKHYTKQSKFEGSLRQVRGAILKALTANKSLVSVKKEYPDRFATALVALAKDGLIAKRGRAWRIV